MTDGTAREFNIPLTFLGEGNYTVEAFLDGEGADTRPTEVTITHSTMSARSPFHVRLAKGGGMTARFEKQ
jgi:alpha-glucosidase